MPSQLPSFRGRSYPPHFSTPYYFTSLLFCCGLLAGSLIIDSVANSLVRAALSGELLLILLSGASSSFVPFVFFFPLFSPLVFIGALSIFFDTGRCRLSLLQVRWHVFQLFSF